MVEAETGFLPGGDDARQVVVFVKDRRQMLPADMVPGAAAGDRFKGEPFKPQAGQVSTSPVKSRFSVVKVPRIK